MKKLEFFFKMIRNRKDTYKTYIWFSGDSKCAIEEIKK